MEFKPFTTAINKQLSNMFQLAEAGEAVILRTNVPKVALWDTYLQSFPAGTNPIFRERGHYDCNCCKSFIHRLGSVVALRSNGSFMTIWDDAGDSTATHLKKVCGEMQSLIRSSLASKNFNIFYVPENEPTKVGLESNQDTVSDITWNHFHFTVPISYQISGSVKSAKEANLTRMKHIQDHWDAVSVGVIYDLAKTGSLYRGEQYLHALGETLAFVDKPSTLFDLYSVALGNSAVTTIKNSSIGELIDNYIESNDLEASVGKYEAMVAPSNYKRTSALVTPRMIEKAKKMVEELGLTQSLVRKLATINEVPRAEVLYGQAPQLFSEDPFASLQKIAESKVGVLTNVTQMSFEKFLSSVVPTANKIEMLVEHGHSNRVVSLVNAVDPEAPLLFPWDNSFSWAYAGDVTDSLKQRVKAAGGKVDADVRHSLEWFDYDDLDLRLVTPWRNVYYGNRRLQKGSSVIHLDVDMNICADTKEPLENIYINQLSDSLDGEYVLQVTNFTKRSSKQDFNVEVEANGVIHNFSYQGVIQNKNVVDVCSYRINGGVVVDIKPSNQVSANTKTVGIAGVQSNTFVPVQYIMNSPNGWDGKVHGINHIMFMLEGMKNESLVRPYFNEFLKPELQEHRKVFEMLGGAQMLETANKDQLTGLGFNKQQSGKVTLRVTGKSTRLYEVTI